MKYIRESDSTQKAENVKELHKFVWYSKAFMYLRAILCIFQISVDFYYVPVGWRDGDGLCTVRVQLELNCTREYRPI